MTEEEIKRHIRLLWTTLIASVLAGAVCVTLVAAHLMHDANEFSAIWKKIAEEHRK